MGASIILLAIAFDLRTALGRMREKVNALLCAVGVLIALADQYRLTTEDYTGLVERFSGERIVAAEYAGSAGVPAIFPCDRYPLLEQLRGERGAKPILQQLATELVTVPMPAAEHDIDTPAYISGLFGGQYIYFDSKFCLR